MVQAGRNAFFYSELSPRGRNFFKGAAAFSEHDRGSLVMSKEERGRSRPIIGAQVRGAGRGGAGTGRV